MPLSRVYAAGLDVLGLGKGACPLLCCVIEIDGLPRCLHGAPMELSAAFVAPSLLVEVLIGGDALPFALGNHDPTFVDFVPAKAIVSRLPHRRPALRRTFERLAVSRLPTAVCRLEQGHLTALEGIAWYRHNLHP